LLDTSGNKVELGRGKSVWLPASSPEVHVVPVEGAEAQVFRATPGAIV
jgi:mannose-6-phosphate isomerase